MNITQTLDSTAAGIFAVLVGNELNEAKQGKQKVEDVDYKVIATLAWELATTFIGERPCFEEIGKLTIEQLTEMKNAGTLPTFRSSLAKI